MDNDSFDRAAVDGGPAAEWYREAAEAAGQPWPPAGHHDPDHARPHDRPRHDAGTQTWPCPKCGGPRVCPDLASTLPYRACGYAETPGLGWVHE